MRGSQQPRCVNRCVFFGWCENGWKHAFAAGHPSLRPAVSQTHFLAVIHASGHQRARPLGSCKQLRLAGTAQKLPRFLLTCAQNTHPCLASAPHSRWASQWGTISDTQQQYQLGDAASREHQAQPEMLGTPHALVPQEQGEMWCGGRHYWAKEQVLATPIGRLITHTACCQTHAQKHSSTHEHRNARDFSRVLE